MPHGSIHPCHLYLRRQKQTGNLGLKIIQEIRISWSRMEWEECRNSNKRLKSFTSLCLFYGLFRWPGVKNLPATQENWVWSLSWEDPLKEEMVTHSSILAWGIPWTEEPGRLQSMGSQRVGYNRMMEHSTTTNVTDKIATSVLRT